MKIIAIDAPNSPHHLDHLVPLCDFLSAPILIRDPENKRILEKYYPKIPTKEIISLEENKEEIGANYQFLLHSFFWPKNLFRKFFEKLPIRSIFTPHGNSDKNANDYWMQRFAKQDICLIYGDHMKDFLKEKKVNIEGISYYLIGNMRYEYYRKHHKFFSESFTKPLYSKLDKNKRTILYAPTNHAKCYSSSLFQIPQEFLRHLSEKFNLIIKVHPALFEDYPAKVYPLIGEISRYAIILEETPLIYPLLEICDAYIGDYSSIGYDFLTFNRPMFFLKTNSGDKRSCFLHQCGTVLKNDDPQNMRKIIEEKMDKDPLVDIRKKFYSYTFYKNVKKIDLSNVKSRT